MRGYNKSLVRQLMISSTEWVTGGRNRQVYSDERQKRIDLWRELSGTRILVCGDSYSDPEGASERSWINRLQESHSCVVSKAVAGASNIDILKQLTDETWTLAIINLTSLKRVVNILKWDRYPQHLMQSMPQIVEQNKRIAKQIISLPNTVVWSPFPHYENWPDVHYRELRDHDDIWVDYEAGEIPTKEYIGNHYTEEGNDITYQWVTQIIEQRLCEL